MKVNVNVFKLMDHNEAVLRGKFISLAPTKIWGDIKLTT